MKDNRWLEERRTGLGGSDMPSVLGVCPFGGTPLGVWKAKVGLTPGGSETNPDIERGNFLEPIIRGIYRKDTGNKVLHQPRKLYRSAMEPWAIAHLDGEIEPAAGYGPETRGVLEIKAPRIRGFVNLEEHGVPANYQIQVQHYLGVTGLTWADFVSWNADCFRLLTVRMERDQELIDMIFEAGRNFWNRHVLTGIPPGGDAVPLVQLENLSPTVTVLNTPEWLQAAAAWQEAKAIQEESAHYLEACRATLTKLAQQEQSAKIRGGGISFTIAKNGNIIIRSGKQEITA